MKVATTVVSLLLIGMPLVVSAQESASATIAAGKLPLAITDPKVVEGWNKFLNDGPIDPKLPAATPFLVTLNEKETLGRFRFQQRCVLCHTPGGGGMGAPNLSKKTVMGREDAVRKYILDG